uniref:Uncharacterized protein n=1 Tax=Takifugu rubripes TaxID=31033 RepID=A0A674NBR8_TAKRU
MSSTVVGIPPSREGMMSTYASGSQTGGHTPVQLVAAQSENQTASQMPQAMQPSQQRKRRVKVRKSDEAYLSLGFTSTMIGQEERPQWVVCLKVVAADSLKPNKMKRHLETHHPEYVNKHLDFFLKRNWKTVVPTQLSSYKVAFRVAQCKKAHTIAEELILPAAIDMVSTIIDESTTSKLKTIPLSNNSISRRISDLSADMEEQLIKKIKDGCFALQMDEATDSNKDSLLTYVRYIDVEDLKEGYICRKANPNRATAEELFLIIDTFLKEADLKWEDCVGVCTDGAQAMAGKHSGLQFLSRVFELNEIGVFLTEEGHGFARKFHDEKFLQKLAYLSDIFQKLNGLNLQLQGTNTHLPQLTDKIACGKMWERRLAEGNVDSFENLKAYLEKNELENTILPCMKAHISALQKHFGRYFPEDSAKYDWIRDPFQATAPADLSATEEEQYIDMTSDSRKRLQFTSTSLAVEWIGVEKDYPLLGQRAMDILLPFATSYLCETRFSAVAEIKTKYRSESGYFQTATPL